MTKARESDRLYSFARLSASKDSIVNGVNITEIVKLLDMEQECQCTTDARMVGASGGIHRFDLVARKGFETICVGLVQNRTSILDSVEADFESSNQLLIEAMRLGLKSMDCGSNLVIMIHLSSYMARTESVIDGRETLDFSPQEAMAEVLQKFNIKLIEAPDIATAAKKLREILGSMDLSYAYRVVPFSE